MFKQVNNLLITFVYSIIIFMNSHLLAIIFYDILKRISLHVSILFSIIMFSKVMTRVSNGASCMFLFHISKKIGRKTDLCLDFFFGIAEVIVCNEGHCNSA